MQDIKSLVEKYHLANEYGVVTLSEPFKTEIGGRKETVEAFNLESSDVYLDRPFDLWFGFNVGIEIVEKIHDALTKQINNQKAQERPEKEFTNWADKVIALDAEYDRIDKATQKAERESDEAYRQTDEYQALKEINEKYSEAIDEELRGHMEEINEVEKDAEKARIAMDEHYGADDLAEKRRMAYKALLEACISDEGQREARALINSGRELTAKEKKALAIFKETTYNPD